MSVGWHWMLERGEQLMKFPVPVLVLVLVLDAAAAASLLRWLIAALVLADIVWFASRYLRRWLERQA